MSELALKLIREAKETRATRLDLGNCGLTELPDELFELTWLEELNLSDNGIVFDAKRKKWKRMQSSRYGSSNNLKQVSPKIESLIRLKSFVANGSHSFINNLSDLSFLRNLHSLKSVDLSHSEVSDLSPIENLKNLEHLKLSETKVVDITVLSKLKNIKSLIISQTGIENIEPLSNLHELILLDLL